MGISLGTLAVFTVVGIGASILGGNTNGYKAQVVVYDRECCLMYKEELDKLLPEEASTIVMHTNNDKEDRYKKYRRNRDQEAEVLDQFRDKDHPLKRTTIIEAYY